MASIFKSSIGKKLIMSITGICLILFLTFHMVMNLTYVFDSDSVVYGTICKILSMGWVNVVVPVLAAFFILHIAYAFILTLGNRAARGEQRYAVPNKAKTDSWSARNMFVLGLIVLCGIGLHLANFWAKMQLQNWLGGEEADPYVLMETIFGQWWILCIYLVWFFAVWFHLTHGFWSALQTLGWNNQIWFKRWKWIACVYVTLLMLGFAVVAIYAFCKANGCC
ncbi:MAG: succinate dehydrogenase cytochrome b subunit [Bacteroidales bacterium]|nr:succinate dehydrogenase cytochrome b subunit [Bacteroidales bacterium]